MKNGVKRMTEMIEIEIKSKILKHILNDLEKRNNNVLKIRNSKLMSIQVYYLKKLILKMNIVNLNSNSQLLKVILKLLDIELQGDIDPYIELFTIDEIIKQNKHENEVIKNVL